MEDNIVNEKVQNKGRPSDLKIVVEDFDVSQDHLPIAKPPDGGFGWVIVFASFMCNVIVDGIIFSFGILLLEISRTFKENRANTAWIGSLQAGFYLTAGPVVSALSNKFGCRRVTIFGSILASIGFLLSFFATSIKVLYVTFGVLGGIGFGFIFLPAIVTVGFYFDKRRAFATGIAVCGSGIGAFIMAPVTQYLIEAYGWRGCILVHASIILNCAVFGSLFRPVEEVTGQQTGKNMIKEEIIWREMALDEEIGLKTSPTASENSAPPPYSEVAYFYKEADEEVKDSLLREIKNYQIQAEGDQTIKRRTKSADHQTLRLNIFSDQVLYNAISLVDIKKEVAKHCFATDIHGSVQSLPSLSSISTASCFSSISDMFDLTLFSSLSFLLLTFTGFLCLAGFFIPFMYIADRAIILGCSVDKSAFLLSIIGITNTLGRVFCGWISDHPRVDALLINNVALTLGGVVTLLSPILFNTYTTLIVYGSIFGFSIACFAALRSVITVELLGLERLTSAFGLQLLFQGVASIIGSPLAGWFFDITGSYDYSFYLSGSVITISGLISFLLPVVAKWEQKRLEA